MKIEKKSLLQLFVPIYIETLFYMLAGMVDTLMLSTINDKAVGAVGTSNTYISMFILMFSIVSTGMMAVMTQNIGAKRPGVAYQAKTVGLVFNLILGAVLSIFLLLCSRQMLQVIGIAPGLKEYASTYIRIVGGTCFLNALIPIFAGYLRAFGYTKYPLVATIVGNIVNLVLNSIFLFIFHFGVTGVAFATVTSKVVNLCIVIILSIKFIKAKESPERIETRTVFRQIILIGLPAAFEGFLYNVAMTLAIRFLNQMDKDGFNVSARAYTAQIANFSFSAGAALAQANAIMTGWRLGSKEYEACKKGTRKAWFVGVGISVLMSIVIACLSPFIIPIFTDDAAMIKIVTKLLWIDVALELGRVTNLVYGQALKTAGDAICPVVLAIVFMFLCAVCGTYFFGIHLGLLAVGCYIALALDELCRGVGMILRWKSGKWMEKGLISS